MNKTIKYLLGVVAITAITIPTVLAFQNKPEKTFNFKFTQREVEVIWYVLDNSTASHNDVKTVQEWFSKQYSAQVDTTIKKK